MIAKSIEDISEISMVGRWLKEYEAAAARKLRRKQVLAAIADGYDVLSEICAHTGIGSATARRIILDLVAKRKIKSAKIKNSNNRLELRFELI